MIKVIPLILHFTYTLELLLFALIIITEHHFNIFRKPVRVILTVPLLDLAVSAQVSASGLTSKSSRTLRAAASQIHLSGGDNQDLPPDVQAPHHLEKIMIMMMMMRKMTGQRDALFLLLITS